ncbi:MAG: hypothetical protein OEV52_03100 [Dehalococcoidia bacterium]|nr:hypothetical protein [Dehalococcoidia bacterium]
MKRNGVRAEARPRLLLCDARALAIPAGWVAMALVTILGQAIENRPEF